jgi:hypothetical protein
MYNTSGGPVGRYELTNASVAKLERVTKIDSFAIKQKIAEMTETVTIAYKQRPE